MMDNITIEVDGLLAYMLEYDESMSSLEDPCHRTAPSSQKLSIVGVSLSLLVCG